MTYRAEDVPPGVMLLGSAYRRPVGIGGAEIRLAPLAESEVREWAPQVLGPVATRELSRLLYERSAGLPLVLEEDLLALGAGAAGPAPVPDRVVELERGAVPRSLQEAVAERVSALGPEAAVVVQAAGVLAVPATQHLLATVAGLDDDRAEQGLTEALAAAVLCEVEPGRYGFRHVLAQQAVYRGILGPSRRRLHLRAIEALRQQSPSALVQIAHHTRQLGDPQAWVRWAEAEVEHAIDTGDDGVAAGLLRDLLTEPALSPDARSRAALNLSRVARYRIDGGVGYPKGVGVHANSSVLVYLGGACRTFDAVVGVDDEIGDRGSVTFELWADGKQIAATGVLTGAEPGRPLSADVSGATELELRVTTANDGANYDHADWADARLTC